MDIKQYIASGILEEYCMGLLNEQDNEYVTRMSLLYPEIKEEMTAIEYALENYVSLNAISPNHLLKDRIFAAIGLQAPVKPLDLNDLPLTDSNANLMQWLDALKHLIPEEPDADFMAEPLRLDAQVAQTLVITKFDVPEEAHGDLIESFFILKGECICAVGDQSYHLHPGDFLEIPLNTDHTIQIVTPYVVGILQHRMLPV